MQYGMGIDSFTAENVTVDNLIKYAFHTRRDLVVGWPEWSTVDRFDIAAKVTDIEVKRLVSLDADQRSGMLRAMLEERFGLKYHFEQREAPIYKMVFADGGARFRAVTSLPFEDSADSKVSPGEIRFTGTRIAARRINMGRLAEVLAQRTGHSVIDATGIEGQFDLALSWPPDDEEDIANPNAPEARATREIVKQLGLSLIRSTGNVRILVIDRLEHPAAN